MNCVTSFGSELKAVNFMGVRFCFLHSLRLSALIADACDSDVCTGRKDVVSVVLPTKEQQQHLQDYNNDDQFESLPAAAAAATGVTSSSSLLAVSAAQQSSTNIHLQAVNQRELHTHTLSCGTFSVMIGCGCTADMSHYHQCTTDSCPVSKNKQICCS